MSMPQWNPFSDTALDAMLAAAVDTRSDDGHPFAAQSRSRRDAKEEESSDDDAAVFRRLRAGDRETLDTLYRAEYRDLWQFAYTYVSAPELADEVVQDVFIALMTNPATLPQSGTIRGYLFASVRNRALNAVRFTRRTTTARERLGQHEMTTGSGQRSMPDTELVTSEIRRSVAAAVHSLPERQQRAVLLRYAAHLSFSDVATALGVSPDAARMLVNRATADLRERLAGLIRDLQR